MAISIKSVTTGTDDGSTATVSLTTSESPSATLAGDLVVVIHCNDFRALTNMVAPIATGTPTMTLQGSADGGTDLSHIKVWTYVANTAGAQSVSTTETGSHDGDKGLSVYVLSGADTAAPIDGSVVATMSPSVSVSTFVLTGVTTTGTDSLLFGHNRTSNGAGTASITQPGSMTERYDVANFTRFEGATEQLVASGATGTRTFTPASSVPYVAVLFAVKAASAATAIPYNPQRATQARDYGEAQWLQRDRRDANTVATAANPLPAPLDAAFGAGGQYWHLYNDSTGARGWRAQQRATFDPSLLTPAATIPAPVSRTPAARDYGEAQWLQRPARDQITSALLENELLGGAATAARAAVPATHAARWWMPQQPPREGYAPGLLDAALLEDALLAGDIRRHGHAAVYTDRREVPQQRLYISDPSTYPTVDPTDPLTLAYGAGGHYWLLYNQAALATDRREVPQQRTYVSDPALLASAALEGVLLGGADTIRHLAWFTTRRQVPQQRIYTDPAELTAALLEGVLLGGADAGRHAAWFPSRRVMPQQPSRATVQAVAILADPLQLDGDRWRRTLAPATHADRRRAGFQPPRWTVYVTEATECRVHRPNTGTVARGTAGTVTRPYTGIVEFCTCCI